MERRKILLGSGSIIAIALAGCTSVSSDQEAGRDGNSESNGRDETDDGGEKKDSRKDNGNNDNTENDENDQHQDENHEYQDIPGFDREAFEIDSEVIQVKKLSYRDHKLDIRVMITTTDRDVLAEELRALAPGLNAQCVMAMLRSSSQRSSRSSSRCMMRRKTSCSRSTWTFDGYGSS